MPKNSKQNRDNPPLLIKFPNTPPPIIPVPTKEIEQKPITPIADQANDSENSKPAHTISLDEFIAKITKSAIPKSFANLPDGKGNTLLHIACIEGHAKLAAELIIRHDADLSIKNSDGDTPLHAAIKAGKLEVIEIIGDVLHQLRIKEKQDKEDQKRAENYRHMYT